MQPAASRERSQIRGGWTTRCDAACRQEPRRPQPLPSVAAVGETAGAPAEVLTTNEVCERTRENYIMIGRLTQTIPSGTAGVF